MRILDAIGKHIPENVKKTYSDILAFLLSIGLEKNVDYNILPQEFESSKRISIVVPIHNAKEMLIRCLKSLEKFSGQAEVILVDDASPDKQIKEIIDDYVTRNNWKAVYQKEQKGHSRACEAGAAMASRDIICLLNSDTVVTHRCWNGMVKVFDEFPHVGIAGPSTSWAASKQRIPRATHCRFYWNDREICSFAEKHTNHYIKKNKIFEPLPHVIGFAFFVRRDLWVSLKGFSSDLKDYGNEVDFCNRAIGLGYQALWVRSSYIHHFGKMSYGKRNS